MTARLKHFITILMTSSLAMMTSAGSVAADDAPVASSELKLLVEIADTEAVMLAVGLSSLAKLRIDPFDIETVWTGSSLSVADVEKEDNRYFQLLKLDDVDEAALAAISGRLAVMRLWRSDDATAAEASAGHLLVASDALPPDLVEAFVTSVQDNPNILGAANINTAKLDPSLSMTGELIPNHDGVLAYLGVNGPSDAAIPVEPETATVDPEIAPVEPEAAVTESEVTAVEPEEIIGATTVNLPEQRPSSSEAETPNKVFTLYFDTDDAMLGPDDFPSVAAACAFAATLPNARFLISGHTDTVGPKEYNTKLSRKRAQSVANAIKNDVRFREALSVIEFGERELAITTGDDTDEPKNRRVEITVIQGDAG